MHLHIDTLHTYLSRIVPFGFAGAALVAHRGQILLREGYGRANRATGALNTAVTVFNTGSITKQFTAAGIMKLAMQAKLSPQDPINRHLPDVPEDKASITLHHLLTHTAGLVNYVADDYVMVDREEMLAKVLNAPLRFTPGEQYEYSNAGYSLLAAIIEIVSGRPYETFLQNELLQPAGLQHTGYRFPDWSQQNVAHWYTGDIDNGTPLSKPYPSWSVMGNGEMLSTLDDLYHWHNALSDDALLSPEAKEQMFTPFLRDYAYGWRVVETELGRLIHHNGASDLGSSAVCQRFVDEDLVIILFFNQAPAADQPLCILLDERITEILHGADVTIPPFTKPGTVGDLRPFTGRFWLPSGDFVETTVADDGLVVRAVGQQAINLLAFPDQPITAYEDLNEEARRLFEAAVIQDNYAPFQQALGNDSARAQRYRDIFVQACRDAGTGQIEHIAINGTIPSPLAGAIATHAVLVGEHAQIAYYLHWLKGKIHGISPALPDHQFTLLCQPTSHNQFVGYDLSRAQLVEIVFAGQGQLRIQDHLLLAI